MKEEFSIRRYDLKNLDCAACAAKLERGLTQAEGVLSAAIDFAGMRLQINARNTLDIEALARRIDPVVHLIAQESSSPAPTQPDVYLFKREIVLLAAAAVLFAAHVTMSAFPKSSTWPGWAYLLTISAYLLSGWNVLANAFRTLRRGDFFDENVLMVIATAGAFSIGALSEAVAVMLFYKVGELLQEKAVHHSRRSIGSLLAVRPGQATVQTIFGNVSKRPDEVLVGETILVKPGEKIPLDGIVLTGGSQVDTAPLTGESTPKSVEPGSQLLAGSINLTAALTAKVTRPFASSSIAKILDLVQNAASRKAQTEKTITTFARYYTPAVVAIAAAIAVMPPLLITGADFEAWLYRALVLLVISCPCALMVSVPLGYFGGIGHASKRGILVKGSNFIDALALVNTVVFDKTGTLTQGVAEVEEVAAVNGYTKDQVLAFAACAESHSTHPIGISIVRAFTGQGKTIDEETISNHQALAGQGVRVTCDGREILVGSDALLHKEQIYHEACGKDGSMAHVVVDGTYAGFIRIGDRLKPQAKAAVAELRKTGISQIAMLTGDSECAARKVSTDLELDEVHAGLLPEDKVQRLETLMTNPNRDGKVAFVGDGINDAPVLARADVGVAMGALGSDAAIESADVVLMTDSPSKLAEAIRIAKNTRRIVWQNIVFALSIKGGFILFGAMGLATMWEAVFADMGTALLAVVNSMRAMGKH